MHLSPIFEDGAITNPDMLIAKNTVAESRLILLKYRVDYQMSLARLKMASGQNLY